MIGRTLDRRQDTVLEAVEDLPVETALEILARVAQEIREGGDRQSLPSKDD